MDHGQQATYLVCGGDNGSLVKELLQVLDAIVRDTNGLGLACLDQLLQVLPGVDMRPLAIEVTRAILELWEEWVVAISIHGHWPVDEIEVDIVEAKSLQAQVDALFWLAVIGIPQLRCDEDVFALSCCQTLSPITGEMQVTYLNSRVEGLFKTLTNFLLVAVHQSLAWNQYAVLDIMD